MTALANLPEKWRRTAKIDALQVERIDPAILVNRMLACADELTAALSPAELGGVEAVAWRFLDEDGKPTSKWADMDAKPMHYRDGMLTPGAYPGTSIQYAYTTPRAAEAVAVDDPMIYRFRFAYEGCPIQPSEHERVRIALAAALTPPSAKGE